MGSAIMGLSQVSYTVSTRFYNVVQIFILLLFLAVMLLFIILLGMNSSATRRARQRRRTKKSISTAVKKALSATSQDEIEKILPAKEKLFSRMSLGALSEVYSSMDKKSKRTLRNILLKMDCVKYLTQQLETDNEDYLVEIIRLAGELRLEELSDEVARLMLTYKENINLQYEAFLTLARLGSYDNIVKICMDESFMQALSFRSLQEVIDAYTGDKPALYKKLLASPDIYIARICIKRIGLEKIQGLAPDIEPFLDNKNFNLVIDAIRTLSTLHYKPVAEKIAALLKHERWEVRSVAATALAAIDANAYIDQLIEALQDSEWQVRYNAGLALSQIKDSGAIREKVFACGDRFACDMWEYMTQMTGIRRTAK